MKNSTTNSPNCNISIKNTKVIKHKHLKIGQRHLLDYQYVKIRPDVSNGAMARFVFF